MTARSSVRDVPFCMQCWGRDEKGIRGACFSTHKKGSPGGRRDEHVSPCPSGAAFFHPAGLFCGLISRIGQHGAVQDATEILGIALCGFHGIDALCAQDLSVF